MNRRFLICAASLSLFHCAGAEALDPVSSAERSNPAGQKLAAELRSYQPEKNLDVSGSIVIRDGNGKRRTFPFRYQIVLEGNRWKSIYEAETSDGVLRERLMVVHAGSQANRYFLARTDGRDGAFIESGPLTGDQIMIPFAGTDFWLADLGREFLFWPEQRIVEEARIKMRKSRPCKVLESRNPLPGASGYTRVRSWIDRETGGIILAEAYGPDGRLTKEFEVGGVTKVNGRHELKQLEMRDTRADSRTVFEFKYDQAE